MRGANMRAIDGEDEKTRGMFPPSHSARRAIRAHIAGRAIAVLAASCCALLMAVGVGATASSAATFGPHDPGLAANGATPGSSSRLAPHTPAPLTLANIVVTDLSTNAASVISYDNPAPIYPTNINCNTGTTDLLCLNYGDGPGPNGGAFLAVPPGPLAAGQSFAATMSVSADNTTCGSGTFNGGDSSAAAAIEVDQYVFTSGPTPVQTVAVQFDCTNSKVDISGTIAYNIVPTDPHGGYYLYGEQGEITGFGNDNYLAYLDGAQYVDLNAPIVGMAPTPDGGGYWMAGSDGGVFTSGDANFYGSTGNLHLNKPVLGMAATPDGKGYWFVASDGGIFSFGDAQFYGSTGGIRLNKPVVGMAATPDGRGYWLVASDGGIFSFGDAQFYGSTGNIRLNKPVVGMTPTPSGSGYWLVASDGGIFSFGDAGFYGSTGNIKLNQPIVGMTATPDGRGYWFTASDGGIFSFGSAVFSGSLGGTGVTDVAGMSLGASSSPG